MFKFGRKGKRTKMVEFENKGTISRSEAQDAYVASCATYIISFLKRVGIGGDLCDGLEKVAMMCLSMLNDPCVAIEFEPDMFEVYLKTKGYTITDG